MLLLAFYSLLFIFSCIYFFIFLVMLYITATHKRFHLVNCIVALVTVCHFVRPLMAFVCQGLLTY